jgi:putative glutathione S-transferase
MCKATATSPRDENRKRERPSPASSSSDSAASSPSPRPQTSASDVEGLPPVRRRDWTLDTDTRTWPTFGRVSLQDGILTPDRLIARGRDRGGEFLRPPSEYLGRIPSAKYAAEAGRYHLFVSGICPWASSVATVREILGLQDVISMDIADGQSGAGWAFLDGASVAPWQGREGPFWLHEAYQCDNAQVTTRITVPVLWDTKTNSIVSNDSWTIVKMMSTAFAGMGKPTPEAIKVLATDKTSGHPTLTPPELDFRSEKTHSDIYGALLNGVYKAGLGLFINGGVENETVLNARKGVYDKLSELNLLLSKQRFLLGDKMTAPDVRLAMTLFRWDASYRDAFVLKGGRGGILIGDGYPNLKAYLRDLYVVMEPAIDFVAIRQYYRIRQGVNKAFVRSQGKKYEEEKEKDLPPIPDLREIIASAKKAAGPRP